MPSVQTVVECLSWLTVAGYLVLYLRLRRQKLHRVYRIFAAYVLFRAVRSVALVTLPRLWYAAHHQQYLPYANNAYGWIWALTEPVVWILQVLVVLELYALVFQNHKGIASLGRWTVLAGLTMATVLSSMTLPSELSHSAEKFAILRCYSLANRGLDASMVIFLLFITAFLVWFPVPLNRNVVLYSMVYALYFIVGTLAELAANLGGLALWDAVNLAVNSVDLACLALWIVFLNRSGEAKTVVFSHTWTTQHEELLMRQLEAINASLLRSAPE
ncbi:MAG TPA: hypothetical protein VN893_24575 [Bryobacteraceae bacterium]|nr:hypothetical protein [Bryobacteraceae bacterium]